MLRPRLAPGRSQPPRIALAVVFLLSAALAGACSKDNAVSAEQPLPPCSNQIKDSTETDIDCGGSCSTKCPNGQGCLGNSDCKSSYCLNGICQDNQCNDHVQDGAETDIDCGGATCIACELGQKCRADADCKSKSCPNEVCAAPSCTDGRTNQDESDVDCGGSSNVCDRCSDGRTCKSNEDCKNHVCAGDICVSPKCSDGVKNGTETDTDCGGGDPACPRCANTRTCNGDADCTQPLSCEGNKCVCKAITDCPGEETLCGSRTCSAGTCGMASHAVGEVSGPEQCERYVCDGAGAMQTSHQVVGTPCTESGGTACDGAGVCGKFAIFDDPYTTFDNSMFGP